jgi:hypothetical protein
LRIVDVFSLPLTLVAGVWLSQVKRALHRMPISKKLLQRIGVMPIHHHYYEPIIYANDLRQPLNRERNLPGLDLNLAEQLELLEGFNYNQELADLPLNAQGDGGFHYLNDWFGPGDAEFLFNMIRHYKPATIIEIGSGYSSLMARYAIDKNDNEDSTYRCRHLCIEPHENPWLERTGAEIVRTKVEELEPGYFGKLERNDILFIDSSHVIRPQGDVLFEYLELLGSLKSGVIIHIHDIFTPRDYLERWVLDESKLYNEQYLMEAFLSYNDQFRIIGSLNHLWHHHRGKLGQVCPILLKQAPEYEPGSFWLVRN